MNSVISLTNKEKFVVEIIALNGISLYVLFVLPLK